MPSTLGNNIIDSLVPILDDIRDEVQGIVGDRQYRVFLVQRTWTGNRRGEGEAVETETEITPRPMVSVASSYSMQSAGKQEEGTVKVTEVSLTYTEAELNPTASSTQEVFYRLKDGEGQALHDEEYILTGSPTPDRTHDIGWVLSLKRAQR